MLKQHLCTLDPSVRFANSLTPEGDVKQQIQKEYYRSLRKDSIKFLTPLSSPSPFNVLYFQIKYSHPVFTFKNILQ